MPSMAVIETVDIDVDSNDGSQPEKQNLVVHPAATEKSFIVVSREISPDAAAKTKKAQKVAKQSSLFAFFGKRHAVPSPPQIKKVRNKQPKAALDENSAPAVADSTNANSKDPFATSKIKSVKVSRKGKYKVHKKADFLHICTGTLRKPKPVDEGLLASLQNEPKGKDDALLLPVIPTLVSCLGMAGRVHDVDSQGKDETSDSLKEASHSIGTDQNQNKEHDKVLNQLHSTDSPEIETSSKGPSVSSKEEDPSPDKAFDPTAMETSIDSPAAVSSSKGPSPHVEDSCLPMGEACDSTAMETSIDSPAAVSSSKGPSVSPHVEDSCLLMGEACDSTVIETSIDSSVKEKTGSTIVSGRDDAEEHMSESNDPTESMDSHTESVSSPLKERSENCVVADCSIDKCNELSSSQEVASELKESSLDNQAPPTDNPAQEVSEKQSKREIAQSEIEISQPIVQEGLKSSKDISKSDVVSSKGVTISNCEIPTSKVLLQKPEIPKEDTTMDLAAEDSEGAKSNSKDKKIVTPTIEEIPTKENPETPSVSGTKKKHETFPFERSGLSCDSSGNTMSSTYNGKHMNSLPEQTDPTHMIPSGSQTSTEHPTAEDPGLPDASSPRSIKTPNDDTSMKEAVTVACENVKETPPSPLGKNAEAVSLPKKDLPRDKVVTTEEPIPSRQTTSRPKKKSSIETPKQADNTNPPVTDQKMLDLLEKHENMREMYRKKALKHLSEFVEQDLKIKIPNPDEFHETSDEFPDSAVPYLVSYIEGSKLPLSKLTATSWEQLNKAFSAFDKDFSISSVSTKIKMLATRKDYAKNLSISSELRSAIGPVINITEDDNHDHFWRWEVTSLELLPSSSLADVKKARASWRKFSAHFNAMTKLMLSLDELIKILRDSNGSDLPKIKVDKSLIKIDREEQKVLKFEREQEKTRLITEARRKKLEVKEQKLREEKEKLRVEKERLAEEKRKQKQEAAQAREEMKRKKALEREEKQRIELEQQEHRNKKQKSLMMSFFQKTSKTENTTSKKQELLKETPKEEVPDKKDCSYDQGDTFDAEKFRSSINSLESEHAPLFGSLSKRAVRSRKKRTRRVSVTVHVVSTTSTEGFDVQPYLEEREVEVLNRYRFLRFHEDLRPPYYGTWSKSSGIITGKTPFRKDTTYLDYDNDSEAEWEEGDDEPGEDVENDAGDDDENMDGEEGEVYNYEDGWLAADDDLGCEEEIDEETKLLRKKRHQAEGSEPKLQPVCIVAPGKGGLPVVATDDPYVDDRIFGISTNAGLNLVLAYNGQEMNTELFLDAFPPLLIEENDSPEEGASTKQTNSESKQVSKELSGEDLKKFAQFVHCSTYLSKSKVVDEFRASHVEASSSRAQAFRALDSIAEKKRHPSGVYWVVKEFVLRELGLEELLQKKPPFKECNEKGKEQSQKDNEKKVSPKDGKVDRNGRKRKASIKSLASAQVLASFLKRAKKSPDGK